MKKPMYTSRNMSINVTSPVGCSLSPPILGVLFTLDAVAVIVSLLYLMSVKPPKKAANSSDVLQWAKTSMGLVSLLVVVPLQATAFTGAPGTTNNRVAAVLLQHLVVDFYPLGQLALAVTRLRVCLCKGNADVLVTKASASLTLGLCFLPLGISVVLKAFISLSTITGSHQTSLYHYCFFTSAIPDQLLQSWYSLFVLVAFDIVPFLLTFVLYAIIQKHYRNSESNAQRRPTVSGRMQRRITIVQHHRKTGRSIGLSMGLLASTVMLAWVPYVVLGFTSWSDSLSRNKDTHHAINLFCIVVLFLLSPIGEGMFLSHKRDNINEVFKQLWGMQARRRVGVIPRLGESENYGISVDNTIIYNVKQSTEQEHSDTRVNVLHKNRKQSECSLFAAEDIAMNGWMWNKMKQSNHFYYYDDDDDADADSQQGGLRKVRFSTDLNIETAGSESDSIEGKDNASHDDSSLDSDQNFPKKIQKRSSSFHVRVRGAHKATRQTKLPSEYYSQSCENDPFSIPSEYHNGNIRRRSGGSNVLREGKKRRPLCRFCPQTGKQHRRASDFTWKKATTPCRKHGGSRIIHEESEDVHSSRRRQCEGSERMPRSKHSVDIFQSLHFDPVCAKVTNCLPPIQSTTRHRSADIVTSNLPTLFQTTAPLGKTWQAQLPQDSVTLKPTNIPMDIHMSIKKSLQGDMHECYDICEPLHPSYIPRHGNRRCSGLHRCYVSSQQYQPGVGLSMPVPCTDRKDDLQTTGLGFHSSCSPGFSNPVDDTLCHTRQVHGWESDAVVKPRQVPRKNKAGHKSRHVKICRLESS